MACIKIFIFSEIFAVEIRKLRKGDKLDKLQSVITRLFIIRLQPNFACHRIISVCSFCVLWHIFSYGYFVFYYINTGGHLGFSSKMTYFWKISIVSLDNFCSLTLRSLYTKGDICIITWSQMSLSNSTIFKFPFY